MTRRTENFNLLWEPWIPVLRSDGTTQRLGILDTLKQAHNIRQIAASNPMDRIAILRFLLSVVYWCRGNPVDDFPLGIDCSFKSHWFEELESKSNLFNLFGESHRFYQISPISKSNAGPKFVSSNYLIHEIPTGSNFVHFRHVEDLADGLCPACCAIGLLRLPVFSTSGGRGKPPGINSKPPCYVMPIAKTVAGTLRLLWAKTDELGTPFWQTSDFELPLDKKVPLLNGMTWTPRRVWLGERTENVERCVSCGSKDHVVTSCVFDGIGSQKTDEDGPQRMWRDPHALYVEQPKKDKYRIQLSERDALGATDASVGQWKSVVVCLLSDARLLDNLKGKIVAGRISAEDVHLLGVGFSTVKNDKYLEVKEYRINLGELLMSEDNNFSQSMSQWDEEFRNFSKKLISKTASVYLRSDIEAKIAMSLIRPNVENSLLSQMHNLMTTGNESWTKSIIDYGVMTKALSHSYAPGLTTDALERRTQIANLRPIMNPERKHKKK